MSSGLVLQNFDARAIGRANRGRDGGFGHKEGHDCRAALTTSLNNLSELLNLSKSMQRTWCARHQMHQQRWRGRCRPQRRPLLLGCA